MINWKDFIICNRGLLIAPAGHGKTTAIADCILQCPDNTCQLVLTHTHAGIASLKTKFRKKNIPSTKYKLETITGFAQRYVLSFLGSSVLPDEEDREYFNVAVEKCCSLVQSNLVQTIIKASFDGIFVDEYQDCTIDQHNMIIELVRELPLHVLGDPLQGVFSFENKPLVDFEQELESFTRFNLLSYPWRWKESNPTLGNFIFNIRKDLEAGHTINFDGKDGDGISIVLYSSNNDKKYKLLGKILSQQNSKNILILCPSYQEYNQYGNVVLRGGLNDRIILKQRTDYTNRFSIIDAIDSIEYYKCAKKIDLYLEKCLHGHRIKRVARLHDILATFHLNISEINKWIDKDKNVFRQRTKENALFSQKIKDLFSQFEMNISLRTLQNLINYIVELPQVKLYHRDFYHTINKCFDIAQINSFSMFEAMGILKTRLRHQGRKIEGCCYGTTLLTKGLEFDTVILWVTHKYEDAKNFYVAISRACKKLIIMTETKTIKFNK